MPESKRTPCEHLYDIACRELSEVITQRDELLAELRNIATADPLTWEPDMRDQFRPWAQSRARAAICRVQPSGPNGERKYGREEDAKAESCG
jgi:hypothetical protein